MFGLSIEALSLVWLIVFTGCLIQGVIGYGVGMFSAPLLFIVEPEYVPGPMILISTFLTIVMLLRDRADMQTNQVTWTMWGGLAGTIIAGILLSFASGQQFQLIFGCLIVLAVLISFAGYVPAVSNLNCIMAGSMSGFMGTLTAVGGPPVAILYQKLSPRVIKANLSAFFLFLNIIAVITLLLVDKLDWHSVELFVLCIPSIVLGFKCSSWAAQFINPAQLRWVILSFSGLAGLASIVRALW